MSSIRKVFKVMKFSGMKEHSYLCSFHLLCLIHSMKSNEIFEKLASFFSCSFFTIQYYYGKKVAVPSEICGGIYLPRYLLSWLELQLEGDRQHFLSDRHVNFFLLKKVDNHPWVWTQVTLAFLVNKCQLYFQCFVYISVSSVVEF